MQLDVDLERVRLGEGPTPVRELTALGRTSGAGRRSGSRTTAPTATSAATRRASSSGCSPTPARRGKRTDPHRRRAGHQSRPGDGAVRAPARDADRARPRAPAGPRARPPPARADPRDAARSSTSRAACGGPTRLAPGCWSARASPPLNLPVLRCAPGARCRWAASATSRRRWSSPIRSRPASCRSPRTSSSRSAAAGPPPGWLAGTEACGPALAARLRAGQRPGQGRRANRRPARSPHPAPAARPGRERRGRSRSPPRDVEVERGWLGAWLRALDADGGSRDRAACASARASCWSPSTRRRRWRRCSSSTARGAFGPGPVLYWHTYGPPDGLTLASSGIRDEGLGGHERAGARPRAPADHRAPA